MCLGRSDFGAALMTFPAHHDEGGGEDDISFFPQIAFSAQEEESCFSPISRIREEFRENNLLLLCNRFQMRMIEDALPF